MASSKAPTPESLDLVNALRANTNSMRRLVTALERQSAAIEAQAAALQALVEAILVDAGPEGMDVEDPRDAAPAPSTPDKFETL